MPDRDPLDIQDYLEATSGASKRTRTITIILVIASILVLAGWLNSLESHWMQGRMLLLGDVKGPYTRSYLGEYPKPEPFGGDKGAYDHAKALYEQRYTDLCAAVEKAYVDNSLVVR